jgi:hypothetical protein
MKRAFPGGELGCNISGRCRLLSLRLDDTIVLRGVGVPMNPSQRVRDWPMLSAPACFPKGKHGPASHFGNEQHEPRPERGAARLQRYQPGHQLYTSRTVQTTIQEAQGFVTPTVFKGQVYVGADSQVEVFGLCITQPNGCEN